MDKISLIVPVYNIDAYLKRCVLSILKQTYDNLELILVDDGSTDNSGQLCDEFATKDDRITVIHKKNGGLSSARNAGLQLAQGSYIMLIDGDDYIHPQTVEIMYRTAKKLNADIVSCGLNLVEEEKLSRESYFEEADINCAYESFSHPNIFPLLWEKNTETVVQCNKLIRAGIIKKCRYPEGKYHEDVFVIHELLAYCSKIVFIPQAFYYYVQRSNSIMHSETVQMMSDAIEAYDKRRYFFEDRKLKNEAQRTERERLMYMLWRAKSMIRANDYTNWLWIIQTFREEYKKTRIGRKSPSLVFFFWMPSVYRFYYQQKIRIKK